MGDRDTIAMVMGDTRIAILTYEDPEGRLVSTPMGTQDFEDPGTARLNTDRAKLEELWDPSASMFMKGGPEDPNAALLEVTGDTAQLWESPGKVGMVVQMVKGRVSDEDPAKDSDAPIVDL